MDAMKALQSSGARTAGAPLKLYNADARRSGDIRPPQRDSMRVPSPLQGLMHMLSNRPGRQLHLQCTPNLALPRQAGSIEPLDGTCQAR